MSMEQIEDLENNNEEEVNNNIVGDKAKVRLGLEANFNSISLIPKLARSKDSTQSDWTSTSDRSKGDEDPNGNLEPSRVTKSLEEIFKQNEEETLGRSSLEDFEEPNLVLKKYSDESISTNESLTQVIVQGPSISVTDLRSKFEVIPSTPTPPTPAPRKLIPSLTQSKLVKMDIRTKLSDSKLPIPKARSRKTMANKSFNAEQQSVHLNSRTSPEIENSKGNQRPSTSKGSAPQPKPRLPSPADQGRASRAPKQNNIPLRKSPRPVVQGSSNNNNRGGSRPRSGSESRSRSNSRGPLGKVIRIFEEPIIGHISSTRARSPYVAEVAELKKSPKPVAYEDVRISAQDYKLLKTVGTDEKYFKGQEMQDYQSTLIKLPIPRPKSRSRSRGRDNPADSTLQRKVRFQTAREKIKNNLRISAVSLPSLGTSQDQSSEPEDEPMDPEEPSEVHIEEIKQRSEVLAVKEGGDEELSEGGIEEEEFVELENNSEEEDLADIDLRNGHSRLEQIQEVEIEGTAQNSAENIEGNLEGVVDQSQDQEQSNERRSVEGMELESEEAAGDNAEEGISEEGTSGEESEGEEMHPVFYHSSERAYVEYNEMNRTFIVSPNSKPSLGASQSELETPENNVQADDECIGGFCPIPEHQEEEIENRAESRAEEIKEEANLKEEEEEAEENEKNDPELKMMEDAFSKELCQGIFSEDEAIRTKARDMMSQIMTVTEVSFVLMNTMFRDVMQNPEAAHKLKKISSFEDFIKSASEMDALHRAEEIFKEASLKVREYLRDVKGLHLKIPSMVQFGEFPLSPVASLNRLRSSSLQTAISTTDSLLAHGSFAFTSGSGTNIWRFAPREGSEKIEVNLLNQDGKLTQTIFYDKKKMQVEYEASPQVVKALVGSTRMESEKITLKPQRIVEIIYKSSSFVTMRLVATKHKFGKSLAILNFHAKSPKITQIPEEEKLTTVPRRRIRKLKALNVYSGIIFQMSSGIYKAFNLITEALDRISPLFRVFQMSKVPGLSEDEAIQEIPLHEICSSLLQACAEIDSSWEIGEKSIFSLVNCGIKMKPDFLRAISYFLEGIKEMRDAHNVDLGTVLVSLMCNLTIIQSNLGVIGLTDLEFRGQTYSHLRQLDMLADTTKMQAREILSLSKFMAEKSLRNLSYFRRMKEHKNDGRKSLRVQLFGKPKKAESENK